MAVSLPNHAILAPLHPSASLSSSNSMAFTSTNVSFKNPHRPSQQSMVLGFSRACSFAGCETRSSLVGSPFAAFSVGNERESDLDEEMFDDEAVLRDVLSLKALIRVYKQAILVGDRKIVAEIEARINVIGNNANELVEKVSTLTAEVKSGKEKYIRLQADFDNFRKRAEKERDSVRSNTQGELIGSLLPMVDNFERAKQQLKPETEMEKKIDASYQGIYKQFVEIMRSLKVTVVPTVGKQFNPLMHEAIAREESAEFKEGIIIEEFCRGFMLKERLLRPAMVKVSSGSAKKAGPTATTTAAAAGVEE